MKVSQKEKQKTRLKLIQAAVDVITKKGFKAATMREIAELGGVSGATIYNYFTTKEKILLAYFEEKQRETIKVLKGIEDFHTYTLQEQLQTLIEHKLEQFLPDREFVQIAFERAFRTAFSSMNEMLEGREQFVDTVRELLDIAVESGEIPDQPYSDVIPELIMDLYLGLVYYWLKDDSENFDCTTQLVDKSLNLVASVLQSGIVGKVADILAFFFRHHIANYLSQFDKIKGKAKCDKRPFMGGRDE